MMGTKKYPTGTKVIYNPPYPLAPINEKYRNRIGVIGGVIVQGLSFPQCKFSDGRVITTAWRSLTQVKLGQLLFSFME